MIRVCSCGCGMDIIFKTHHKYYPPKFINGHHKGHLGHKHSEESKQRMSENSHMWRGNKVKYRALHQWIRKYLPIPKNCQMCNEIKRLTLSNITDEYNRFFCNWLYLCYKYHNRLDR